MKNPKNPPKNVSSHAFLSQSTRFSPASTPPPRAPRARWEKGATLTCYNAMLSEFGQETQMGISHEASEARLLTKQGRQRGHWGLWYHTNLQMGTRGPISCYPITKKVPSSLPPPPPPHFFPLVPPPSHPPLRNRRENRRCWDCIIASITVIIYTSILSYSLFFACYCNQSHQAWCVQLRHAKKCR